MKLTPTSNPAKLFCATIYSEANILNHQLQTTENEAVTHLRHAITDGKHWYIAILEAIGLWTAPEEAYNGRHYCYLIDNEAFDWLLLAERLCDSVDGLLPNDEKLAFLFHEKPPLELTTQEFRKLIGSKYHQYLNYFYGVTVEDALILAVQAEVHKERQGLGFISERGCINEAYRRVYGATRNILLRHFRKARGYPYSKSISITELKEFTYWLFKYRLEHSEKAKVASDTKKGLKYLEQQGAKTGLQTGKAILPSLVSDP